jgi:hypothetical protein
MNQDTIMITPHQSTQLPIDECEEWIWDTLDSTKDCGFEYIKDGNKESLIFNTNDFFADSKALEKIRRTTKMQLVQMSTHPHLPCKFCFCSKQNRKRMTFHRTSEAGRINS